jgi:MerR family mercuric resistance operon transcriptional regulator
VFGILVGLVLAVTFGFFQWAYISVFCFVRVLSGGRRSWTVRYYEKIGLMPAPARSEGGHRLYGRGHLLRLNFVRRARDLGFTLIEIRALLELGEQRDLPCAEARMVAAAHLGDVRAKLAALRKMEKVLVEMVARCADGATPECPILAALFETQVRTEAKT